MPESMIRALFRSVDMPGLPSLSLKIHYPAVYSASEMERNTGMLPADQAHAPYPVAILMPGINVSPENYGWLAQAFVKAGFVCLSYGWILEEMPGLTALTPGLDIEALKPGVYGQKPSATALHAVLDHLGKENAAGPLSGLLDLERIVLGGHSAGGSVALMNARPDWFAGLRAVFAYGAHAKASTMLGYAEDTVLRLPDALPTLIMGGQCDGVIASSAFRYGDDGSSQPDPVGPLTRSFQEGLSSTRGDCYLAIIKGANHFAACWPKDDSTGRPFLDWPQTRPDEAIREDIAALACHFAQRHVCDDNAAEQALLALLEQPDHISLSERR